MKVRAADSFVDRVHGVIRKGDTVTLPRDRKQWLRVGLVEKVKRNEPDSNNRPSVGTDNKRTRKGVGKS